MNTVRRERRTAGLAVMDARVLDFPEPPSTDLFLSRHRAHSGSRPGVLPKWTACSSWWRACSSYPAEPIRGLYVVPTAMILFGNPFRARDIHIHHCRRRRCGRIWLHLALERDEPAQLLLTRNSSRC